MTTCKLLILDDISNEDDFLKRLVTIGLRVEIPEDSSPKIVDEHLLMSLIDTQYFGKQLHRTLRQVAELRVHQYFLSERFCRHASIEETIGSWVSSGQAENFNQRYGRLPYAA